MIPEWLHDVFLWVLRASWQASVLILLVLAVQWSLRGLLAPQWRFGLWFLVLLRLLLPLSLESSLSVFTYLPGSAPEWPLAVSSSGRVEGLARAWRPESPGSPPSLPPGPHTAVPAGDRFSRDRTDAPAVALRRERNWLELLPVFWGSGVLLLLGRSLWIHCRFSRCLAKMRPVTDPELLSLVEQCKQATRTSRKVSLLEAAELESPALYGFFKLRLLWPRHKTAGFTREELAFILHHELHHARRHDIALNWLLTTLQIFHWFNPLVWVAFRRLRSDRELVCDAHVLSHFGPRSSEAYGRTIIKLIERTSPSFGAPGIVGILEDRASIRTRITAISRFARGSRGWAAAGLAAMLALACAGLTDARAPSLTQSAKAEQKVLFRVLDAETGQPILGATLNGKYRTDASGECEVPVSPSTFVNVRAEGHVSHAVVIGGSEPAPLEYVVRLSSGEAIGGEVLGEDGSPVADAEVMIRVDEDPASRREGPVFINVRTDAQGRWRSSEIPPRSESMLLEVIHPEYQAASYWTGSFGLSPASGALALPIEELRTQRAALSVRRGLRIVGVVLDTSGAPIRGARVSQGLRGRETTETDEAGRFSFKNGSPGKMNITVEAKGFAAQSRSVEVAAGKAPVEFYLARGYTVRGRVVDERGNPIQGATVGAQPPLTWHAETDRDGLFVWNSAPDRMSTLQVRAPGFRETYTAPLPAGEEEHEIRLQSLRRIRVSGRVIDAGTGRPISEFRVLTSTDLRFDGWHNYRVAAQGKDGVFTLFLDDSFHRGTTVVVGDAAGSRVSKNAAILIEADGYLPDGPRAVAIEDGDQKLEIALSRGEFLSGIVLLPNGRSASDASLVLCDDKPVLLSPTGQIRCLEDDRAVRADASGRFVLNPMRGSSRIFVTHSEGFAFVSTDSLQGSSRITLAPWGRVEGILMIGRRPAPNETVALRPLIPEDPETRLFFTFHSTTDALGRFRFPRVPPGEHAIGRLHLPAEQGGQPISRAATVLVRPGETAHVRVGGTGHPVIGRVVLEEWPGPVTWKDLHHMLVLKLPPLKEPAFANDAARQAWRESFSATEEGKRRLREQRLFLVDNSDDGAFRIDDVPSGVYELRIQTPDRRTVTKEVAVPEGPIHEPLDVGVLRIR